MQMTNSQSRFVVLTNIPAPYRIPTFNWLAQRSDGELRVAFISPGDRRRNWCIDPTTLQFRSRFLSTSPLGTSRSGTIAAVRTLRLLRQSNPGSVICGGYDSLAAWAAFIWCKAKGRRFVLWLESNERDQRKPGRMKNMLKRLIVSRADAIGASGKATVSYVKRLGARSEQIYIAPFGGDNIFFERSAAQVDAPAEKAKRNWPAHLILYSGRLVVQKGVYVLLEAFRAVSARLPDAGLLLVGHGPELEPLQDFCRRNDLARVYFAGPQAYERMPFFYALADVLALPTFSDAWGFVVNEAFACGVPAIVSSVAGACDDLIVEGKTGYTVEPGNALDLASKMIRVLQDKALRARMSAHCRQLIASYTARACAEGLLAAVRCEK